MTVKICKIICIVSFFVLLIAAVVILGVSYSYYSDRLEEDLEQKMEYVSRGINISGPDFLEGLSANGTRITLIASDGTVLFDSKADPENMENHAYRQEVKDALSLGVGKSERYSETMSEKTLYYAQKLDNGDVIRLSDSQITWLSLTLSMLTPIIVIYVLAVIFSIFLSHSLSKKIVKPLNDIDLEHPEKLMEYEELTPLLSKINSQNKIINRQMEELERKQKEFNAITDNMSEGFIIIDDRAEILSYNASALKLLEASSKDEYKSVLSINRSESFRRTISTALMGERRESILQSEQGYLRIIANPVFEDNKTAGAVILILDETEKVTNENIRREFTSNVSHELKTPLTSISGFAELMKTGLVSEEDTIHFADNIYNEAQRLITLVNDIIKLSKLDEGAGMNNIESVDMGNLAEGICDRLSFVASSNEISIETHCEHRIIEGNRKILEEIIYNLCDNAIKYNKKGGFVRVNVTGSGESTLLFVSDNGIGIPKEAQNRVFERFYRVDKSHSKEIGGTGLGLSIVKHGALYHNAKITLESEPGKGTSITVIFPNKFKINSRE